MIHTHSITLALRTLWLLKFVGMELKKTWKSAHKKIASKNCMIFLNVYDNRKCLSPSRVIQENHSRIYANMAAECLSLVCVCACVVCVALCMCASGALASVKISTVISRHLHLLDFYCHFIDNFWDIYFGFDTNKTISSHWIWLHQKILKLK